MRKVYGAVDLGRYGLAHGLIGWARCVVWRHRQGVQMLAPNWFGLRLGPWLRNERDKRLYWLLFDDRSAVRGWRKLLIQARARRVAAEAFGPENPSGELTVVVFSVAVTGGAPEHFDFIRPYGALLPDCGP